MLRIVTDSASDITALEAREKNIELVYLSIFFKDGEHPQRTKADYASFYELLQSSRDLPKTSQPSPESYLAIYEDARQKGDSVLVLCVSSGVSGTYQSALIAKEMSGYERIRVVDTLAGISAQRLLVYEAVKLREMGVSFLDIADTMEQMSQKVKIYGLVDTLTYLKKGGRIPPGLALLGNTLRLKPLIGIKDGKLTSLGKALGRRGGLKLLYENLRNNLPDLSYPVFFTYSSNEELGQQFMEDTVLKFNLKKEQTGLFQAGAVIGTHVGPNCVAVCYIGR